MANRLPVRFVGGRWVRSPGGLVSALLPVADKLGGAWVGWAGVTDRDVTPRCHGGTRLRPVSVCTSEAKDFYDGYSNAGLWPLLHDAIRPPVHDPAWWHTYQRINRRFATTVARSAAFGARVLVQDYQLMLVPRMFRELRPDLRIAFFLHTPFPSSDVFATCPDHVALLHGLLGADLVGVQTSRDRRHLRHCVSELLGAHAEPDIVRHSASETVIGAFPIAIDAGRVQTLASRAEVAAEAFAIRASVGDPTDVLLGVDRLDYTKGIETRLLAYQLLLRAGALDAATTPMIQIAVPTRENVPAYGRTKRTVVEISRAINDEFGSPLRPAVHLRLEELTETALAAHYRAADVMVVTPIRDGMNLVAKEYVASRVDDTGALVLSTGAGAAEELSDAHLVAPCDVAGTAAAIMRARTHRCGPTRMARLRRTIFQRDVHDWAGDLLRALG